MSKSQFSTQTHQFFIERVCMGWFLAQPKHKTKILIFVFLKPFWFFVGFSLGFSFFQFLYLGSI